MNSLSWFIYFVQLADSFVTLCILAAIACAVAFAVRVIVTAIRGESAWSNAPSANGADTKARKEIWDAFNPMVGRFIAGVALFASLAAVIPSRQTLLLIAGSEAGERIAKSDGVKSIVDPGMDLVRKLIKQEADKINVKAK